MHLSSEILLHRTANRHIAGYQQTAPRDTGLMADTSHVEPEEPTGRDQSSYHVEAVSPQPYAAYPEFGTVHQAAQPSFLPEYENAKREMQAEARTVTETILKGGSLPVSVGIRRSIIQPTSPTAGVVRKVRGNE